MATTIQSVERAAQILLYVAGNPNTVASEISSRFALTEPTTHHLLTTLVQEGLLTKDRTRRYRLGPASEQIADYALRQMRPSAELRSALSRLARMSGESCYLTAWRGDEIRIVSVMEGEHAVRVAGLDIGYSDNLHARVGARVILAYADAQQRDWALASCAYHPMTPYTLRTREALDVELESIRESGLARDREQLQIGVYAISMPLVVDGQVRAALSLAAPIERFFQHEEEYIAALRGCAIEPL
jgi:IclR family transcriptional regulator, acetate operon repressor